MPIVDVKDEILGDVTGLPTVKPEETPTFSETVSAAFRSENVLGSFFASRQRGGVGSLDIEGTNDTGFDPFAELEDEYQPFASSFIQANSREEVAAIKRRIDLEQADRGVLLSAGGGGIAASFLAGFLDPINVVPIGGPIVRAAQTGRVLKGVLNVGKGGFVGAGLAEAGLQATQDTRTALESVINVTASTFLMGILGGGVGVVGKAFASNKGRALVREASALRSAGLDASAKEAEFAKLAAGDPDALNAGFRELGEQLERDFTIPPGHLPDPFEPGFVRLSEEDLATDLKMSLDREVGGSVGAAATPSVTLSEQKLINALGAITLTTKIPVAKSPSMVTMTSPLLFTRQVSEAIADVTFTLAKHLDGKPSMRSVETLTRMWDGPLARVLEEQDRLFVKMRTGAKGGGARRAGIQIKDKFTGEGMTFAEFKEAASMASRRGDAHEIPEVAELARFARSELTDPLKLRAIEGELMPEGVTVDTAISYFSRVYNSEKIIRDRENFLNVIEDWLRQSHGEVQTSLARKSAELARVRAEIKSIKAKIKAKETLLPDVLSKAQARAKKLESSVKSDEVFADVLPVEFREIAESITDKVTGANRGRVPYENMSIPLKRGPLLERTLNIPDERIEPWLINDFEKVLRQHVRTVAPDAELAIRFGDPTMGDQIGDITRGYRKLFEGKTPAQNKRLAARRDEDIRMIAGMRDRLRGTYTGPAGGLTDHDSGLVRTGVAFRQLALLAKLGGMTLSAFPDIARVVMTQGLRNTIGEGLVPLIKNLKGFKVAAKEMNLSGAAYERTLNSRALAIADLGDEFGRHTKFERGLTSLTRSFGNVSLMAPWNDFWKSFLGTVYQTRISRAVLNAADGKASQKEISDLAKAGLSDHVGDIAKQLRQHQTIDGPLTIPNTTNWSNRTSIEAFRAAINKEVNAGIVTPGIGDRPLWMSAEWGKMVGQFKSFNFASAVKVTVSGLQQRDMAFFNGAVIATVLGMGVYYFKAKAAGREVSDNPLTWIAEGIDRSGIIGNLGEAHNIIEKSTGGAVGVGRLVGGPQLSRFASRNVTGALLGPTLGTVEDLISGAAALGRGDFTRTDLRRLRRTVPYQNLIYFRNIFNAAEEGIGDALGLPDRRKRRTRK